MNCGTNSGHMHWGVDQLILYTAHPSGLLQLSQTETENVDTFLLCNVICVLKFLKS